MNLIRDYLLQTHAEIPIYMRRGLGYTASFFPFGGHKPISEVDYKEQALAHAMTGVE